METVREDACIATERLQRDCRKGEQHSLDPVNKLQFRFLSRSENVSLARLLAAALAASREMTVAELDEIKVAVSEAVSNAIIHGYEGRDGNVAGADTGTTCDYSSRRRCRNC